ncbi:N-acetyltransferase family protein [Kribbella sp. NPDC055071]
MRHTVRRYAERDRRAVLDLASRLAEGVAPWRPTDGVAVAVSDWVLQAVDRADEPDRFVYVAEVDGVVAGFVSGAERRHWSGQPELYVGELAVSTHYEGHGVGRGLIDAVSEHAKQLGLTTITLDTGAANTNARAFYQRLGFEEEDVKLTKRVDGMIGG